MDLASAELRYALQEVSALHLSSEDLGEVIYFDFISENVISLVIVLYKLISYLHYLLYCAILANYSGLILLQREQHSFS